MVLGLGLELVFGVGPEVEVLGLEDSLQPGLCPYPSCSPSDLRTGSDPLTRAQRQLWASHVCCLSPEPQT